MSIRPAAPRQPGPSPLVIVLTICTVLSLTTNIVILFALHQARSQARFELLQLSQELAALRSQRFELTIPVERSVPVNAQVPVQQSITVPINTVIAVDTEVTIPLNTPFGNLTVPIPVRGDFPINTEVPVTIDFSLPVATDVQLDFDLPIVIPLAETPLDGLLAELEQRLRRLSEEL